jgi:hypothetical protein
MDHIAPLFIAGVVVVLIGYLASYIIAEVSKRG